MSEPQERTDPETAPVDVAAGQASRASAGSERGRLTPSQAEIERLVAAKQRRKLRAQAEKNQTVWFGLGMMGLIGWSVAVPSLVGVAIGLWIDSRWPGPYSWTLMFLIAGIVVGSLNAWNWLHREGVHPVQSATQAPDGASEEDDGR